MLKRVLEFSYLALIIFHFLQSGLVFFSAVLTVARIGIFAESFFQLVPLGFILLIPALQLYFFFNQKKNLSYKLAIIFSSIWLVFNLGRSVRFYNYGPNVFEKYINSGVLFVIIGYLLLIAISAALIFLAHSRKLPR